MSLYDNQRGAINGLLLPLIVAVLLLIGAVVFGGWAFTSRQDYKNNVDAKISTAVEAAKLAEDKVKDAQFAEERKNPLRAYNGPSAYGSVVINYPNTWSGYVSDTKTSDPYVDGYFSPGVVPDADEQSSTFALRVEVSSKSYSDSLRQYQSQSQNAKVTVQPYALPKVPSVVGSFITGEIENNKQGYMVLLPLRNTTLKIWTESDQYKADFNNIILPNASFSP
jgi:hypothetical protein